MGRVDSGLWFVIGCCRYREVTGDKGFFERMLPAVERVMFLAGAWEFNNRGLIYVPLTGDWADEYLHSGYVFFDQLLYHQAQRLLCERYEKLGRREAVDLRRKSDRLRRLLRTNFWQWHKKDAPKEDIYHPRLYNRGCESPEKCDGRYWLPFFSPTGFGYRFDAFGNVLASLVGVAGDEEARLVDEYIDEEVVNRDLMLLPAFHPVIGEDDQSYGEMHWAFSYHFKNKPYEYQNGGLWPFITGFYVADLARRGKHDLAKEYLAGIYCANAAEMNGESWAFPECLHGKSYRPEGTPRQGWSAAGAIIGHKALDGQTLWD